MDHMAYNPGAETLMVAALGNNTLEAVDLKSGKVGGRASGLHEPQGVAFVPGLNRVVVANGEGGECDILDAATLKQAAKAQVADDADNVRYDDLAKRVWVGCGAGALTALDPADGKVLGEIKLAGHPESFQLETKGPRIFVNIPSARQIAVVNRESLSVAATWKMEKASANFPMALDEEHRRLIIGCRKPATLLVLDMDSGAQVAECAIAGDTDDVFYDAARKRIYASCGEGFISVIQQSDSDHYAPLAKIATAQGARTSFLIPQSGRLALTVPHRGKQSAEIRVYQAAP